MGLLVNGAKCKVLTTENQRIEIDGRSLENVHDFIFLGSVVPGTNADVTRRIALASVAFGNLQESVWENLDIPRDLDCTNLSSYQFFILLFLYSCLWKSSRVSLGKP